MKRRKDSTSEYSTESEETDSQEYSTEEEVIVYSDTEIDYSTEVVVIFPGSSFDGYSNNKSKSKKKPPSKKTKIDIQREKTLQEIKKLHDNNQESILNQILDSDFDLQRKALLVSELENVTDKEKIKTYIKKALKIPLKESNFMKNKENIVEDLRKNLDETVYGHTETKEEIIDFVTSKINNPNYKSQILALHGPPGIGKCHAKDTPIMMYDGSYKMVQDIQIGDSLMGDDSTPRKVTNLGRGKDTLYEIKHRLSGKTYTVNSEHILCLIPRNAQEGILEISLKNYIGLSNPIQHKYRGYSASVDFPYKWADWIQNQYDIKKLKKIPDEYKINSYTVRLQVLGAFLQQCGNYNGLNDTIQFFIHHEEVADDLLWIINSLGILCDKQIINSVYIVNIQDNAHLILKPHMYKPRLCPEIIQITNKGEGDYFGFTLDGNYRYVINDFIVTHNTRFIRALGKTLGLPFNQISFGGLNDVSVLTGHDYTYVGSKPGKIYDALAKSKYKDCIIYLDEIDKISSPESEKFIAINGVLTHMLDPEQNMEFHDSYFGDISLDLSKVFFIVSFNSSQNIDPVVLNRLRVIEIKESTFQEKVEIVKRFSIPEICKNIGIIRENINFNDDTIRYIINVKTKADKGMRSINKNITTLISKINTILHMEGLTKEKREVIAKGFSYEKVDISKYRKGEIIHIDRELVDLILRKQEEPLHAMMYI